MDIPPPPLTSVGGEPRSINRIPPPPLTTSGGEPNPPESWRRKVIPYVTKLAHGSTPFITTFLLIHLSAPALANLGGSSLSSQVMILGREYYQTSFGETYLLLAPIAIHTVAGITKRLLTRKQFRRSGRSPLALTGYLTLFLFLPVHYLTHRIYPSDPSPPIFAVGPSELDYEFAKTALQVYPWRSWILYGGLTLGVAWHAAEGISLIWNTWLKGTFGPWRSTAKKRAVSATLAVVPVLTGVWFMSQEPLMAFTSQVSRFQAALSKSLIYRL